MREVGFKIKQYLADISCVSPVSRKYLAVWRSTSIRALR